MSASTVSLVATGCLVAGVWLVWCVRWPRLALVSLVGSLVVGQTVRGLLPGQGGGILVSDMATIAVLLAGWFRAGKRPSLLLLLLSPFLLWTLGTLVIQLPQVPLAAGFIAILYWVRLATTLLLVPVLVVLFRFAGYRSVAEQGLYSTVLVLALLGLLQRIFLSDISVLSRFGWDPHQGRVVSTWLDPNYFGAFLAITLPFIVASRHRSRWAVMALSSSTLILTQSRSTLVAVLMAGVLLSPLILIRLAQRLTIHKGIALAAATGLVVGSIALGGILLGSRFIGLIKHDPTVELRASALRDSWPLVEKYGWIGSGYNLYQFVVQSPASPSDFTIHSRAGTDNSLLVLWITTGLVGVLLFLLPVGAYSIWTIRQWLLWGDTHVLAASMSLLILLIHSQFVNSLLYSHLLITLLMIISLSLSPRSPTV